MIAITKYSEKKCNVVWKWGMTETACESNVNSAEIWNIQQNLEKFYQTNTNYKVIKFN